MAAPPSSSATSTPVILRTTRSSPKACPLNFPPHSSRMAAGNCSHPTPRRGRRNAKTALAPPTEIAMTIQRFENGPRMSRVVVHNDTVYRAGLTAEATVGHSVAEQTKEILGKIDG